MNAIATWLAADPTRYYMLVFGILFAFGAAVLGGANGTDRRWREATFLSLVAATLFICRLPILLCPYALNVDESLWAAGALKVAVDPVPWRGFDGTTSGPINSYILALPALFGGRIDFFSTRVTGAALLALTLFAIYYAAKWFYSAAVARVAVMPPLLLFALTTEHDFVHFSSEYVPIFFSTVLLCATAYVAFGTGTPLSREIAAAIAGLCVAGTCFAKLQAVPLVAVLSLFLLLSICLRWFRSPPEAIVSAAAAVGSAAATSAVLLVPIWWTGGWEDALISYVKSSLSYVAAGGPQGVGPRFFFETAPSYTAFIVPVLVSVGVAIAFVAVRQQISARSIVAAGASLLFLLVGLYVIWKPHRGFPHYLLFSVVPLTCCFATAIGMTHTARWSTRRPLIVPSIALVLFAVPALSVAVARPNRFVGELPFNINRPLSAEAAAIARYARPGDFVAIWGWAADLYVHTGTVIATREGDTSHQLFPTPYLQYFQERYMKDIQRSRPIVFVDAVTPGGFFKMNDPATQSHENFPALAHYVRENYDLREQVNGIRIYVAKSSSRTGGS